VSMRGSVCLCGLCAGPGGQGDLLSELQGEAGVDIVDYGRGKRAKDKDTGGVQVFIEAYSSRIILIKAL
jgi:hypothetical protein